MKLNNWIEIFAAGEQTDSHGNTKEWTVNELDEIVNKFTANTETYQVPVVIGHPETDSPAYGWVSALKREGGRLLAQLTKLHDGFVEGVIEGRWPNRSVRLGKDNDGRWQLRHIGFLGAAPPAVKGLAPAYNNQPGIYFDYMKKPIPKKENPSDMEPTDTDEELPTSESKPATEPPPDEEEEKLTLKKDTKMTTEPTVPDLSPQLQEATAQVLQLRQEVDLLKKQLLAQQQMQKTGEFNAFIDKAIVEGRLTPAQSSGLREFLLLIDGTSSPTELTFNNSDGKSQRTSPVQWLKDFISKLPPQLKMADTSTFTSPEPNNNQDYGNMARAVEEYLIKHPNDSFMNAFNAAVGIGR